jgi:protein-tyrosine phosphatase
VTSAGTTVHAPAAVGAATVDVLVVCTANICRSPVAEALLTRALAAAGDVRVSSAGLHALTGRPMAEEMARLLDDPPPGFAARQVTPELVRAADLVLVMTREQRSSLVGTVPAAVRRTFTLLEFAELAGLADRTGAGPTGTTAGERLRALVRLAPRLRASRPAGAVDDIDDPYGRGDAAAAAALAGIQRAVADIAGVATGA